MIPFTTGYFNQLFAVAGKTKARFESDRRPEIVRPVCLTSSMLWHT